MIVDELVAILGFDVRGEDKLRQFNQAIEQTATRIAAMAAAAAVAAAAGMAVLGKSVISVSAQFESLEASLTTVTGSVEQAQSSMDWIKKFARETPYEVGSITEAFIRLKSFGIDPLADDALKTLGDTASAMNKPLNQAVEALADATTFEFERLKEFGLRAKQSGDEVTFSWNENGKELTKTIKKNSEEVRKFVLDQLGDRFHGAMLRQSKTWNGMISNLSDSWTQFLLTIGESGFFETVKGKLGDLLDLFNRLDRDGTLKRWGENLSRVFVSVVEFLSVVATRIGASIDFIREHFDILKPILIGLGVALAALGVWFFPVITGAIALGLAIDDLITYLQGGPSVIGEFIDWCKRLPETLSQAARAFSSWLKGIDWGGIGNEAGKLVIDAIAGAMAGIGAVIASAFQNISWGDVWNAIVSGLTATAQFFLGYWQGLGTEVVTIIKGWFDLDWAAIGANIGQGILTGLQSIGDAIKAWLASIFQKPAWLETMFPSEQTNTDQSVVMPKNSGFVPPKRPGMKKLSPWESTNGDYIRSDVMDNATKNFARMSGGGAAGAIASTVNDNRNQAVNVTVGGVTVNGVQNASGAVGAAVGSAVGNGAAGGARRATWHEGGEKI